MNFSLEDIQYILSLYNKINYTPIIGVELEFYIFKKGIEITNNYKKFGVYEIIPEIEFGQYEAKFHHTNKIISLINNIQLFKQFFIKNYNANFNAKPILKKSGSAQHINISIMKNNTNILATNNKILYNAIGGLCELILNSMIYFAPNESSYERYIYKCYHTPITLSWGINNRTTAIRLVKSFSKNYRIENRLPGSDADTLNIISTTLLSIYHGIKKNIIPKKPTYGLGHDPIYKLPIIPMSLNKTKKYLPTLLLLNKFYKTNV